MSSPLDLPETYLRAFSDFDSRNGGNHEITRADVYSFPQTWGDTSCGHGGIGGQSITQAQTHVFDAGEGWFVYQNGQHSYTVENPNDQFFNDLRDWNLVGEADYEGQYER